jgi:hypothetical protein
VVQGSFAVLNFNGTAVDIDAVGSYAVAILRFKSPRSKPVAGSDLLIGSTTLGPFPYGEYSCVISSIETGKYVELNSVVIHTWSDGPGNAYVLVGYVNES